MWIAAAALAFLLLYFLTVRWYLPTVWDTPTWDWPPVFKRWWSHATVLLLSLILLLASVVGTYMVSGWLAPIPLVLLLVLISRQRLRKESQIDATIKKAIVVHYDLNQRGLSEPDIYLEVATRVTGLGADELRWYFDTSQELTLENLIQYLLLPSLELWHHNTGGGMVGVADAVAMRDRIRGFQQSFERLKTAQERWDFGCARASMGEPKPLPLPRDYQEPTRQLTDEERMMILEHMRHGFPKDK